MAAMPASSRRSEKPARHRSPTCSCDDAASRRGRRRVEGGRMNNMIWLVRRKLGKPLAGDRNRWSSPASSSSLPHSAASRRGWRNFSMGWNDDSGIIFPRRIAPHPRAMANAPRDQKQIILRDHAARSRACSSLDGHRALFYLLDSLWPSAGSQHPFWKSCRYPTPRWSCPSCLPPRWWCRCSCCS